MAGVRNYLNALVDQSIKAGVISGTVHDDRVWTKYADKLIQTFFKPFTVNELFRATTGGAYADNAVLRYSVPAVTPGF